jgi:peptidoglycan/LPS O-acetylase OafA/YrhL
VTGSQSVAFDPRLAMQWRRPGLDLLRALAIVLVILYHAGLFDFNLPHDVQRFGWIGVDLFFVLSGYLIAGQLFAPLAAGKQPDIARFYERRALRIVPAYFVIVAIYFFLPPALREYERMPPIWKFLSFTQNLVCAAGRHSRMRGRSASNFNSISYCRC